MTLSFNSFQFTFGSVRGSKSDVQVSYVVQYRRQQLVVQSLELQGVAGGMTNTHPDQNGEAVHTPEQDSVSSQQTPSSPERPRRSKIRFPTELDNATASSSKETQTERRNSQRSLYPGLSVTSSSAAASAEDDEEFAVRRRVRSTNSDRSAAYSRTQFVAGPSRSRQSGRRAASHTMYGQEQIDRGVASLGSSPLSQRSMLPGGEGEEGV